MRRESRFVSGSDCRFRGLVIRPTKAQRREAQLALAHRKAAYQKSSAQHAEFALISVVAPIKVPPSAPEMTPTTIKLFGALTDIDAKDRDGGKQRWHCMRHRNEQ